MSHKTSILLGTFLLLVAIIGISAMGVGAGPTTSELGQPGLSFRHLGQLGVTAQPYVADALHINRPDGLFMDGDDNLFVATNAGSRVLEYNSAGQNLLSIGKPGVRYVDDYIFNLPSDVALDAHGKTWVSDETRVVQYDESGNFLQEFPAEQPWEGGSSNDRFDGARSLAFDSEGNLYVADRYNHRVQIYGLSTGSPVYSATLGVTGESGSDNDHFNQPFRLAIDTSDRLYVSERAGGRVQRCDPASGWSCSNFAGGLSTPSGLALDNADNVYIAESGINRLVKCTPAGVCNPFVSSLPGWTVDVAVDSNGNVYASDWTLHIVRKFNSSGVSLGVFVGQENAPYTTSPSLINYPQGVVVSADGDIYVTEEAGYRLLKFDPSGIQQWAVGQPGVYGSDNAHLGNFWGGPKDVAIAPDNDVYVVDRTNHRVQIFNSNGFYLATLGSFGSGNNQFDTPEGIAIDDDSNIYVADTFNHRVQIFDSNRLYQDTLGVTGVPGSDDAHFSYPSSVAVDDAGRIYVADSDNARVQVFDKDGNYQRTIGETGVWDLDHLHFSNEISDVAVDSHNHVFVADVWGNRIQVFDAQGNYLTTIGGSWGSNTSQFRNAFSVAIDGQDNVYVTDGWGHRIQKFAHGVTGWHQMNINGFGDPGHGMINALLPFEGRLYASVSNFDNGAQLWRYDAAGGWQVINADGFGDAGNVITAHLIVFNDQLYAGTLNEASGGQIWRSDTGDAGDWQQVVGDGFGSEHNHEAFHFAVFGGQLYASTWNLEEGSEIWRSNSGDAASWSVVASGGLGDASNKVFTSLVEYGGALFAGTDNPDSGAQVWRSSTGNLGSWTQINGNGFGDLDNWSITLEPFKGYLYAGTYNYAGSDDPGHELWRCQTCTGTDWEQVAIANGFGDPENRAIRSLIVHDDALFAITRNSTSGLQVWRSDDGQDWLPIDTVGLGDSNNSRPNWDNSTAVFEDALYIGTVNWANGGEIWQLLKSTYIPLVVR
jgi:streptogramin lyase